MTALMDDTLGTIVSAVRRLPCRVREPLRGSLRTSWSARCFEMRKRGSSARPAEALQFVIGAAGTGSPLHRSVSQTLALPEDGT